MPTRAAGERRLAENERHRVLEWELAACYLADTEHRIETGQRLQSVADRDLMARLLLRIRWVFLREHVVALVP